MMPLSLWTFTISYADAMMNPIVPMRCGYYDTACIGQTAQSRLTRHSSSLTFTIIIYSNYHTYTMTSAAATRP
eukprot:scaffold9162_cov157-Skeletonema_dohrnii-CCMP3373.AAC.2